MFKAQYMCDKKNLSLLIAILLKNYTPLTKPHKKSTVIPYTGIQALKPKLLGN